MSKSQAFDLLREQNIPEIASLARLYRHRKTGAEVLSLINADENKVFGVTFKTPPSDSTGVAHILEHSVLCGSRKYPVKKPFVEMLKGSMHTFLNAMTFPDKTAYPVASQNLADFYNLVDVYLDAVYFPLITEDTFRQEGWHYEAESVDAPIVYKGVVFNEMKGAFSTPEAVLRDLSQRSLYPDTTYGVSSGGDPKAIPDLSYKDFKAFHDRFYHPSNTRAFFYGDDDPEQRLDILDAYFSEFDAAQVDAEIATQPRFNGPRHIVETYAGGREDGSPRTGLVSVNWMLDQVEDPVEMLGLNVLEYLLLGTSAAPVRKALIDSGLGESVLGSGISESYKQPMATIGLKGILETDGDKVESLILDTLGTLTDKGIDREAVEAAVNTLEFHLRENNTGSYPRGISLMFRSLATWLYDGDPLDPLAFEGPLGHLKQAIETDPRYFEGLIKTHFLDNNHRTTVLLKADGEQAAREAAEERARLDQYGAHLDARGRQEVVETTHKLKALQQAVDAPADLAKIPTLGLADLDRQGKSIPLDLDSIGTTPILFHNLPTNGVVYLDLGLNLRTLPAELLPYVPLFGRALFQTGTSKEDFVSLTRRIGRLTGGVGANRFVSSTADGTDTVAWLFIRGKATPEHGEDLLAIVRDVLTDARLDNRERLTQMVLEEKAGFESRIVGAGNAFAAMRLRMSLSASDWLNEQWGGVSHLFFLRQLAEDVQNDWDAVYARLLAIRDHLIDPANMIANVTTDATNWSVFRPQLAAFLGTMPDAAFGGTPWTADLPARRSEGLIIPAKVNYVGKAGSLYELGYQRTGATQVVIRHLNTSYLWDKVRVEGGAYGGSSSFDPFTGTFAFTSYRDPNLLKTLDAYDGAPAFLAQDPGEKEIVRSVIGVIGSIDSYMLPDAKGYTSMARYLAGNTDEMRQARREEVLSASARDFAALGEALAALAEKGQVVVLGSDTAIAAANAERGNFLSVSRLL